MKLKYQTIIFDLDGTILESHPGIEAGLKFALNKMNRPFPANLDIKKCMGPPLPWTFATLLGLAEDEVPTAVDVYREYYGRAGAFQAAPYPGLMDLLKDLTEAGAKVGLATTKSRVMALKMLDHFGLSPYIGYAAMSSGREMHSTKKSMIEDVLANLGGRPESAVMIGDTHYDAEGAAGAGVDFIGVLYGYGGRAEMEAQTAGQYAETPAELREMLVGDAC